MRTLFLIVGIVLTNLVFGLDTLVVNIDKSLFAPNDPLTITTIFFRDGDSTYTETSMIHSKLVSLNSTFNTNRTEKKEEKNELSVKNIIMIGFGLIILILILLKIKYRNVVVEPSFSGKTYKRRGRPIGS